MILMNKIDKYKVKEGDDQAQGILNRAIESIVLLLSPFTPHMCEELWQKIGHSDESIVHVPWPQYDEGALKQDTIQIIAQVNGKLRGKFDISVESNEDEIKELVLADQKIQEFIQNKPVKKFIYVPGKLVNLVV